MRELDVAQWQVKASRYVSEDASQQGKYQPQRGVITGVRQPLASARNPIVAATPAGNALRRPNLSHPTNPIPNRRANSVSSRPRPIIGTRHPIKSTTSQLRKYM